MVEPTFTPLADCGGPDDLSHDEMVARSAAFLSDVARRHSVRDFAPDPVPQAVMENCIEAAGRAPSGANHQPWHFALIGDPEMKRAIRKAAEAEEETFYAGRAGEEWLTALRPIGTNAQKPFLETAPWLIAIFTQRRGGAEAGEAQKNYYINESVGVAAGFLLLALHEAGLATLTHTPNPMAFLTNLLGRPKTEKPYMLVVAGKPAPGALIPDHALKKKALKDIMTVF